MNFAFTAEQEMLKDNIRKFVKKELSAEVVQEMDEKEECPEEIWEKMASLGWLALPIPEEYGGMGGSVVDNVLLLIELSRGSYSIANMYLLTTCFGAHPIIRLGTETQKKKYLPRICDGSYKWALGFTEPGGGTDILGSTVTVADRRGDQYIIKGQKTFISGADKANFFTLFLRTSKEEKRTRGFSLLIVDAHSDGITVRKLKKLGGKPLSICEIFFENVSVPKENILGHEGEGWYHVVDTLNNERVTAAALSIGSGYAALDYTLNYSKQRMAFGKTIGSFQAIQHRLVDCYILIQLAELMVYKAAWLQTQDPTLGAMEGNIANLASSEAFVEAANVGMRTLGGVGYMMEYPMQRYYRDSILTLFAPITNEMAKNFIGNRLGLGRSY